MPDVHSPSRRDRRLRLALDLERHYSKAASDHDPLLRKAEQVGVHAKELRRITDLRYRCQVNRWHKADQILAGRQIRQLLDLQYLLGSFDRTPVQPRPLITAGPIYRDLLALEDEFDDLAIADDLSTVSVTTDSIALEGIELGRFRLVLDLSRLSRGRCGGDCLSVEALDPNPASSNDEVTHPHVQGGQVCLGDGAGLFRTALAEGRLYDAFVIVNQVLHTYNDASPYIALDRWHGRACDQCDDHVREDDGSCCEGCGDLLCNDCQRSCTDCDYTYCRSCLTSKDDDLLCSACLEVREAEESEDTEEDELQPLTQEEPVHAHSHP